MSSIDKSSSQTRRKLPTPLVEIMDAFIAGDWGACINYFADDASLISFVDDGLQAVLETEVSPIVLNGPIPMAGYIALFGGHLAPMTYDVIAVAHNGLQIATELEWWSNAKRPLNGRTCIVWNMRPDNKVQSVFKVGWVTQSQPVADL
jgi:hypothetical protein